MKCILCGINEAYKDGICIECLTSMKNVSYDKINITVCPKCGSIKINKRWYYNNPDDALFNYVSRMLEKKNNSIKKIYNYLKDDYINVNIVFDDGIEKNVSIPMDVSRESCPVCNKLTGSYYEAIIQLRTFSRDRSHLIDTARDNIINDIKRYNVNDPNSFVSKVVNLKEGIDIYLGKRDDAAKVIKNLDSKYFIDTKVTKSLAGKKDGKDVFRYTHLIRIFDLEPGSIIFSRGRNYMVKSVEPGNINIMDLSLKKDLTMDEKTFFSSNFDLIRRSEKRRFIVISNNGSETELMDEKNFNIVTIKGIIKSDSIDLYNYNDEYYII
ncbi:NMD3-related protein [Picrophilus oshimae]|uniref:NMD protein affecting ribosome stability and mRNA decay n=1 Tax=Picrophilus torridus (strain ATCC 700027 / DSM 9790 / JCM 10055 / NBRC 100828 / KAW 2/3) TaxID=1122961 RepID=Q6KZ46_PICTO|nr:NMD3-related protein [Picrophilus oshimae]AAT44006.1 NMD protein affecting ribosome stability and mRNA decay [Picrophilus oshimae DSM 9789]